VSRRVLPRAALATTLAAAMTAVAPLGAAPAGRAPTTPARVQVTAREHSLTLSRGVVPAGRLVVELVNLGEDDHDLAVRRIGPGAVTRRIGRTGPGLLGRLEATLRSGRYRLWCTLGDHRARGMVATLAVRAPATSARAPAAAGHPAGGAGT
jgi:hypothetical protein